MTKESSAIPVLLAGMLGALALVLTVTPPVGADHERFLVANMRNKDLTRDSLEVISGKCIPSHDRQRLDCYFTQVLLGQQTDASGTSKDDSEMIRELDKPGAVKEMHQTMCQQKMDEDVVLERYNQNYRTLLAAWKTFCRGKSSKESTLMLFRTMKELDAKKCHVLINAWREILTRNIDRWTNRTGPSGLCGVVQTNTLRPHDLAKMKDAVGPVLWTYETHSIYTRPADEEGALFCSKKLSVQSDNYAWNARGRSLLCEDFDFTSAIDDRSWQPPGDQ